MPITFTRNMNDCFEGSYFQGEIMADYADLVRVFGPPEKRDYKTDVEWDITCSDGVRATIYNWKNGRNYLGVDGLPVDLIRVWHIGGISPRVVLRVQSFLHNSLQETA